MPESHWHRSLYLRLGTSVFLLMAVLLAAQAGLFLWATDGVATGGVVQSARQLSMFVASDLASALHADPSVDLRRRIHEQFGNSLQDVLVVTSDGRSYTNREHVSLELLKAGERAAAEATGKARRPDGDESLNSLERRRRVGSHRDTKIAGGRTEGLVEVVPIVVAAVQVGSAVVLSKPPPFSRVLLKFGPTMAIVASGVLLVGVAGIALAVFGPAHRRLRDVQQAAERVGRGDLRVKVPEHGGDEVATLARSFNRMTHALDASDCARRQLLADISHELKTPLTSIRGYVDTLRRDDIPLDKATRDRYLLIVSREEFRLERIVQELLDLARLEARGVPLNREPVAISDLFDVVAERYDQELTRRGIRLTRRVDAGAEEVTGDPDRLEQVVLNLAANALRYAPEQGELTLSATVAENDAVRITVHDSGPGIPPEHLSRVFDRFYKVDVSRKSAGGSGLGLSLVKAIVEYHGGTVSARNENGAVFEILLPRPLGAQAE